MTVLGTCQDAVLPDATAHCGELLYFEFSGLPQALNRPTRAVGFDENGGRVDLTARAADRASVAVADELFDLPGVPDGLVARRRHQSRRGADGEQREVHDRRGLRKLNQVELTAIGEPEEITLVTAEEQWLLQAQTRRWSTVRSRHGAAAMSRAVTLTRAGIVRLVCPVDGRLHVGEPTAWVLTNAWSERASHAEARRDADRRQWRERALAAVEDIERSWPALADALTRAAEMPLSAVTQALLHAAEDLSAGVTYDGPRAFSMAHYGSSKARDDIAQLLTDAGAPLEALTALGVRRSSRLGLAGPVILTADTQGYPLEALDGPVLIRADQPRLHVRLAQPVPLVIVENLQSAESLADQVPAVAIAYTAGPPSDASLRLITELAADAERVVLVPDADLGGVRIAERVLNAVPLAELVDIGAYQHVRGADWPADGGTLRMLTSALPGRAGALAEACLNRGYGVEQELATVRAVKARLG